MLIKLIVTVLTLYFMGKTVEKMGRQFWEGIIPIYNIYVILVEIGKPWWWLLLLLIPLVNLVVLFLIWNELSKRFSQGILMTLVLFFLPVVGFGILAFSSQAVYKK